MVHIDGRRYKRVHKHPWLFLLAEGVKLLVSILLLLLYGLGTGCALDKTIAVTCSLPMAVARPCLCSLCNDSRDLPPTQRAFYFIFFLINAPTLLDIPRVEQCLVASRAHASAGCLPVYARIYCPDAHPPYV